MNALNQMHARKMLSVLINLVIIHVLVIVDFCRAGWFVERAANVKILTNAKIAQITVIRMHHVPTPTVVSHVAVTPITKEMVLHVAVSMNVLPVHTVVTRTRHASQLLGDLNEAKNIIQYTEHTHANVMKDT